MYILFLYDCKSPGYKRENSEAVFVKETHNSLGLIGM